MTLAAQPDIFDLIHEGAFVRSLDGRITLWNKACEELYGWTREEALGRTADDLFGRDGETTGHEAVLLATGRWEGELGRQSKSGADLVVDVRWVLRRSVSGVPLDIVETGRDVTQRRRTEEALRLSEHRYHNLFQAMAASFWELDFFPVGRMLKRLAKEGVSDFPRYFAEHPDFVRDMMRETRILDVNEETVSLFGGGDRSCFSGSVEPFWPEEATHVFAASVIAAISGAPNYAVETKLRKADGTLFDGLFTCCFPPETMNKGSLIIGVIDISERKRAFADLVESEKRYRNIFEATAVSYWQLDTKELKPFYDGLRASGVTDFPAWLDEHPEFVRGAMERSIVLDVNDRTVEMFGAKDRDELVGSSIARFWIPGKDEVFRQCLEAAYAYAPGFQAETKLRTVDGRELDILFFMTRPPDDGSAGLTLVGNIDISEQVAARAALERTRADLAHAARVSMLGELTASIAHEVNQPLAAIATNGEAGLRWLARPEPDIAEVRDLSSRIVADARRAADIISRIRAMASRREPERVALSLNGLIEEAARFLGHEIQAQGASLALDLAPGLPSVPGDRTQLQQVVVNLAVNALQAMAGAEAAERRVVIRTAQGANGHLQVSVEDTGPGIPADALERIFDSFVSTKQGGMGMGLPICRSIVEAHGGSIEAANAPGGGALFSLALPAGEA